MDIQDVYKQICQFAEKHKAEEVILFGSRARGTNQPKSDIDIAIRGCSEFNELYCDLQDNLWSLLQLTIINLDAYVSETLKNEIKRDGVILFKSNT